MYVTFPITFAKITFLKICTLRHTSSPLTIWHITAAALCPPDLVPSQYVM
jgi:hypothetical protein